MMAPVGGHGEPGVMRLAISTMSRTASDDAAQLLPASGDPSNCGIVEGTSTPSFRLPAKSVNVLISVTAISRC